MPVLVAESPDTVLARLRAAHEARTGVPLSEADPEHVLLASEAAEFSRAYAVMDGALRADLLADSFGEHLDALVALNGVARHPSLPGTARFRVFRAEEGEGTYLPPDEDGREPVLLVPAGTRLRALGTTYLTDAEAVIGRRAAVVDVPATAEEPGGPSGDALNAEGEALDAVPGVGRVLMLSAEAGSALPEPDARLRERAALSRALASGAGPEDRFRAVALAAHPSVGAAVVSSPEPGTVRVVVAGHGGEVPSAAALASVAEAVTARDVRPVALTVTVAAPVVEDAELEFSYTLTPEGDARRAEVRDAVLQAMADYRAWQEGALGRDLTPSRLYAAVQSVPGVASVTVVSPPSAPVPPDALVRLTFIAARSGGVQA